MGIPDHLIHLLRNLYASQEATVRTGHVTMYWFKTGKGVRQSCILSPCLFNLYVECITRNLGLHESQARIKTAGRKINNFRYTDATTLMEESEEEPKSFLMRVREESEKTGLILNIQKTKTMASGPIIANRWRKSIVKAMVFPVVRYGCESWTIKKAENWRIDAFASRCWRRLLRVPWTASRSKQSILKEINPKCSLEGLMMELKLQYSGHLIQRANSLAKTQLIGKDPDAGKDWGQEEKVATENEVVG